jgi:hypothetical protein
MSNTLQSNNLKLRVRNQQPIDDGFTESLLLDADCQILYRPLTYRQRLLFIPQFQQLGEQFLRKVLEKQVLFSPVTEIELDGQSVSRLLGIGKHSEETEDCRKLKNSVAFQVNHPKLAKVSCDACRKYWFDPLEVKWTVAGRDGKPQLKPEGMLPMCESCPGICPAGHYQNSNRLTGKYLHSFHHYLECEATGCFPDDAVVRRNAKIIRSVLKAK